MRDDFEIALARAIDRRVAREEFLKIGMPVAGIGLILMALSAYLLLTM